jgi:hypothetical protein
MICDLHVYNRFSDGGKIVISILIELVNKI